MTPTANAIKWVGCHEKNFSVDRHGSAIDMIVIHVMAGTLAGTDNWFSNPVAQVSAHYGVNDHQTHQYVKEEHRAWHAGVVHTPTSKLVLGRPTRNPNDYSIGIEHEGTATSPWSDALYLRSAALVADIANRHAIPLDRDHVVGHHEVYSVKPCPGACDLDRLVALAQGFKS